MPILSGDIKLIASRVMADVPEGGGGPTANVIPDAVSNAVFPDISELGRANGQVHARKAFVHVQTSDTDPYLGSNVIVAEPPDDPRVNITLFSTRSTFDQRVAAVGRIESYLAAGSTWSGFLFESHIAGQRTVSLFQRPSAEVPTSGKTLLLIKNEGQTDEVRQYVRVIDVSYQLRTFTHSGDQDYTAAVVSCEIDSPLLYDFPGSAPQRNFQGVSSTTVRDTVVADAASYKTAVPLSSAATLGALSANVTDIFTQLVPSAQTEIPILDATPAQQVFGLQPSSDGTITVNTSVDFSPTAALHVGGGVTPTTLTITTGSVTLTDANGRLFNGSAEVGLVDYAQGILTIASGGPTFSGGKAINFKPAAGPQVVTETLSIPVTVEGRTQVITQTLLPVPAPGTLTVSYMAQGRWYTISDQGSGTIKGADPSFGVGTLSFITGGTAITLGALPDVGSEIIFSWGSQANVSPLPVTAGAKVGFAFNLRLTEKCVPGSLSLTWTDTAARTVSDDGVGNLTGAATGTINYTTGEGFLMPSAVIPASGTAWSAAYNVAVNAPTPVTSVSMVDIGSQWEGDLGGSVKEGTFSASLPLSIPSTGSEAIANNGFSTVQIQTTFPQQDTSRQIKDDGAGNVLLMFSGASGNSGTAIGTINYTTGIVRVNKALLGITHNYPIGWNVVSTISYGGPSNGVFRSSGVGVPSSNLNRSVNANTGNSLSSIKYAAAGAGSAATPVAGTFANATVRLNKTAGGQVVSGSVRFAFAGKQYFDRLGRVLTDLDPATGAGTDAGAADYTAGDFKLSTWTANAAQGVTLQSALVQATSSQTVSLTFRTPVAPLRAGSLGISGTKTGGTAFTGTFNNSGYLVTPHAVGVCNYQTGVARVWFRKASGTADEQLDLTGFGIPGVTTVYFDPAYAETLRFNATAYTYLPLDASILGIDPVRLPSDGRVPVMRPGDLVVFGHTKSASATVTNGQVFNAGRVRLSRVRILGSTGLTINTGYTADLEAGTVTFTDVSSYSQPITIEDRVEDMVTLTDVQISGQIAFNRQLTHAYPVPGSYVSGALVAGDLFARTSLAFDQATWDGSWADSIEGDAATGTFNITLAPIEVNNIGAITERWIVRFTNTTAFEVIGENVGVIATGNTSTDCAPLNPSTGFPYFTIPAVGWGSGWSTGNILRINTVGAMFPFWIIRTIQAGPETGTNHDFTLLIRGDVDTP